MIYFSTSQEEVQYRPFIVFGHYVADPLTGEVIIDLSVEDLPRSLLEHVREDIDWKASLMQLSTSCDLAEAKERLLEAYSKLYPDNLDFLPGFMTAQDALPGREEASADRGLSNTNKVHKVIIKNFETGEEIELDKREARLSKMRKRVFSWANTINDYLPAHGIGLKHRKVMFTLTYENIDDWKPNHIRDYIKALRRKLGDNLIAYAWVAELQERGAVHYHIELICVKGTRIPMPDKSGMWKHGSSRIETARSVFYICSYVKKSYQKMGTFPKGLRMFSVWVQPFAVSELSRWKFRLSTLPKWLCDKLNEFPDLAGQKWERHKGGGYVFAGRIYKSPFYFMGYR